MDLASETMKFIGTPSEDDESSVIGKRFAL